MQAHEMLFDYLGKFVKLPFKGILIVLALTFTLSVASSIFLYRLVVPQFAASSERIKPAPIFVAKESPTLHPDAIKEIVSRNIFNKTGEIPKDELLKEEKAAYKGEEIVKSELPLKLVGVIYGGTPFDGLAMIENLESKKTNSFLVGENVIKDSVLIEVHQAKIILMVSDHKEFVELLDKPIARGKRAKKKGKIGGGGSFVLASGKYSEEGFERDGNSITMSADYRQKLLTGDFAKVLQDSKAEPVYEGGELAGFA